MAIVEQPGVRIVLGHAGTAAKPPESYAGAPTQALQKAAAKLGKDWKRVAPSFVVAPAARTQRVVVGLALVRAPVILDAPRALVPRGAITREHLVVEGGFVPPPDVDPYGNQRATEGILRALREGGPQLESMGLRLDEPDGAPGYFLISDDGRGGALVYGQALHKPGAPYEGGGVETWSRDYGGGEAVRLIGVRYAEVTASAPIVRLDAERDRREAHEAKTRQAVRKLLDNAAPFGWYLVAEAGSPLPDVVGAPAPAAPPTLSSAFAVRPFAACLAALTAAGVTLREQPADDPKFLRAHAEGILDGPPDPAPHTALLLLAGPPAASVLADPAALMRFLPSPWIGAWNAKGRGKWARGEGWIVADVELASEQEDEAFDTRVRAIVAAFAIDGGWIAAVWPGHRHETLAQAMGFDPWQRASWQPCEVWLGE